MKKRSVYTLFMSLVVGLALTGCGNKESGGEATGNENDVLKVGMEAAYAPFNWTQLDDSNGGVPIQENEEFAGGYDVEIAKKIAEGLGKELVIVKTEWDGLIPALETGVVDAIIAGMSPTAERAESIDFTVPYYKSELVMVVKKGSQYENATSIQDFSGAKITGQQGTFHPTVIEQIDGVVKDTDMADFSAMRVALESGIIDGYVSERPEGVSAQEANDNFVMIEFEDGFTVSDEDVAVAAGIKKGNEEMVEKINDILEKISEEERNEIMEQAIKNQPSSK